MLLDAVMCSHADVRQDAVLPMCYPHARTETQTYIYTLHTSDRAHTHRLTPNVTLSGDDMFGDDDGFLDDMDEQRRTVGVIVCVWVFVCGCACVCGGTRAPTH